MLAGIVAAIALRELRQRRLVGLWAALFGAASLCATLILARDQVVALAASQFGTDPLPDGNTAADYVAYGQGGRLALVILIALVVGEAVLMFRARRRSPAGGAGEAGPAG